jgi:NAD(P)-dependent dehydrogenase (short-subunit alcohol dehydrogenase family)
MGKLDERVAIVTAAASGMGRGAADRLAEEGAHVFVVDINAEAAERTAEEIRAAGFKATGYPLDVTDLEGWKALLKVVEQDFGALHVLHHHAGIPGPSGMEVTSEEFDFVVDVNLKGAFMATEFALPLLERAVPHACILYTASISGLRSSPTSPIYGMTKGGMVNLMRTVAKLVGPKGIRANAICPGYVVTPGTYEFIARGTPGEKRTIEDIDKEIDTVVNSVVPLRRRGTPWDIGAAAAFLASDDAGYITGVALAVDGGIMA